MRKMQLRTADWYQSNEVRWTGPALIFKNSLGFMKGFHDDSLMHFFVKTLGVGGAPAPEDYIALLRSWKWDSKLLCDVYSEISRMIDGNPYS